MTQSRDEVKASVRSNAVVLLRSGRGFDKAVCQEMLAALRPLTPFPPLNTVLILPDGDERDEASDADELSLISDAE